MKKSLLILLILTLLLGISSCGKEETQQSESMKESLLKNKGSLINKDKIEDKLKEKGVPVPIGFKYEPECKASDFLTEEQISKIAIDGESEKFNFLVLRIPINDAELLKDDECIISIARPNEFKALISEVQVEFENEKIKKFKDSKIAKAITAKDITDKDGIKEMLEEKLKQKEQAGEEIDVISAYQTYVTPTDSEVKKVVAGLNSFQEVLDYATQKILWIADSELMKSYKSSGGKPDSMDEHWFYPNELLTVSPTIDPEKGEIKSDCSEQANFLVSALIAKGYESENVRVVLAKVDFGDGHVGGHAFAQYYDETNEVWVALDPTVGPYIENGEYQEGTSTPPMNYFLTHEYEVQEMWVAYNNKYFLDFENTKNSNAPENWKKASASFENVMEGIE